MIHHREFSISGPRLPNSQKLAGPHFSARSQAPRETKPVTEGGASGPGLPAPRPAREPRGAFRDDPRCRERGCVFPAAENTLRLCLYHERLQREPGHFRSYQPTRMVISQAIFGFSHIEIDNDRARYRRRLAAQREAFQEGLA